MLKYLIIVLFLLTCLSLVYTVYYPSQYQHVIWQSQVSPGRLSAAHAQLATNCASCHTASRGVDVEKCINCHAGNTALLHRQPTAFHATIGNCASCHVEHQGRYANLKVMNHEALALIVRKLIGSGKKISNQLENRDVPANHLQVSRLVSQLNCANCHSTKDTHFGLFGQDCASCHAVTQWTIPAFQHPSVNSINCSQCHQAPPSHYMMHFEMVDKTVASQSGNGCGGGVNVRQCYSCHQTTSWNDIKGVGFYKHH